MMKIQKNKLFYFICGLLVGILFNYIHLFAFKHFKTKYKDKILPNNNIILKTKCNYGPNGPRILCAIFTNRDAHSKLHYVHNTWAKRFEICFFFFVK